MSNDPDLTRLVPSEGMWLEDRQDLLLSRATVAISGRARNSGTFDPQRIVVVKQLGGGATRICIAAWGAEIGDEITLLLSPAEALGLADALAAVIR